MDVTVKNISKFSTIISSDFFEYLTTEESCKKSL